VGYDIRYNDWTTTKRFLVQAGMTPTPANATMDLGEVDMAAPASLVAFATWGAATYPAKHYFLDLWDHGLGWQGILTDGPSFMTTAQLASAMSQIRTFLGRNVDIVGNDACRMTIEIMDELRPYVDYFVGSEKDEPLAGWPYDTFLAAVAAAPVMTPVQVGTWLTTAYVASYFGTSPYSVNLALVSGGALPSLVRAFADFVAELNASVPLLQSQVLAARLATERYERNGLSGGDEFDLFHFSENVVARSGNPRLAALARVLQGAIASAVLARAAWDNPAPTNGVHAAHAHGLSIWFPDTPSDPAYDALALSRATGWNGFLATYRSGSPTPIPTGATARSVDTSVPADGLADTIRVTVAPPRNGSLVVLLTEGTAGIAAPEVLARANQTETLNLTAPHAGLYNVTVLYYVGGKLSDLVGIPSLAIQARYWFNGTVRDPQSRPVARATVTLQNARTSVLLSGTTDASGAYSLGAIVPDFFVDGDTLVLTASSEGRQASAAFVASARGTSQTVNIVLDTSPSAGVNAGLIALAAGGLVLAIVLAGIVVWQREQIRGLRRRLP
jgi:chitodextrinase